MLYIYVGTTNVAQQIVNALHSFQLFSRTDRKVFWLWCQLYITDQREGGKLHIYNKSLI